MDRITRQTGLPQEVRGRTDISLSTFPLRNQAALMRKKEMAGSCGQRAAGGGKCMLEPVPGALRLVCGSGPAGSGLQVPADPVLTEGTGTTGEDPGRKGWEVPHKREDHRFSTDRQ